MMNDGKTTEKKKKTRTKNGRRHTVKKKFRLPKYIDNRNQLLFNASLKPSCQKIIF